VRRESEIIKKSIEICKFSVSDLAKIWKIKIKPRKGGQKPWRVFQAATIA